MNHQILFHLIVLGLFLLSLFWVAIRDSKFIQITPIKILAIATIFITVIAGIILCIYDIVLFLRNL